MSRDCYFDTLIRIYISERLRGESNVVALIYARNTATLVCPERRFMDARLP